MRFPRRLNLLAARPDRASLVRFASFRWAALPITDRRWTAPMSAVALGFGIFAGVAIGPAAEGTRGAESPVMVQVAPAPAEAPAPKPGSVQAEPAPPADPNPEPSFDAAPPSDSAPFDPIPTPEVTPPSFTPTPVPPPVITDDGSVPDQTTEQTTDETDESEPALTELAGTILRDNPRAASYTIADEAGMLSAIHTIELPDVADVIEVEARSLANGTFDEGSERKTKSRRNRVSFSGSVTYRDPIADGYTVSGVGSSLFVTIGPDTEPPPLGAEVEVTARFVASPFEAIFETKKRAEPPIPGCGPSGGRPDTPELTLRQLAAEVVAKEDLSDDAVSAPVNLEGIVQGVCREDRKLMISADDVDESGADVTLNVPSDIALKKIDAGDAVLATAVITDEGIYRLTALASDERAKRADDADLIQTAAPETDNGAQGTGGDQ